MLECLQLDHGGVSVDSASHRASTACAQHLDIDYVAGIVRQEL